MAFRIARDYTVSWFLAAWPLPVALIIILFSDRFTSASWRFAASMPGGYGMWAGVLISCSALMLLSLALSDNARRTAAYFTGLGLVGLWWVMLGVFFGITAAQDRFANPIGAAVWTGIGILYWIWAFYERRRL